MLRDPLLQDGGSRDSVNYRKRFRAPYELVVQICEQVRMEGCFDSNRMDCTWRKDPSVELKMPGFLNFLGRGQVPDSVYHSCYISAERSELYVHSP